MKNIITSTITTFALMISTAQADDKFSHFPSLDSPSTSVALCNLAEFNQKLQAIVNKKTITTEDMVKVHELTYTLENAVIRLQKDLKTISVDLEKVHKASEHLKADVITGSGTNYLTATNLLLSKAKCS